MKQIYLNQNNPVRNKRSDVCIIILTKNRKNLLKRAVTSVSKQTFQGKLQILIIGDNCSYLKPNFLKFDFPQIDFQYVNIPNSETEKTPVIKRIAQLRNIALSLVKTEFVAFLDDDNQWLPEHLSTLHQTMLETNCTAVHSWRVLVNQDCKPVIVNSFPWLRDRAQAIKRFRIMIKLGIMSRQSAIVQDRAEAVYNNVNYGMIDCGEWLFRRALIKQINFQTEFSSEDEINMVGEDDKLLMDLRKHNVSIGATFAPTVLYTLGGMSNG
jgi:glycosyltransferase involved in cell wall biosynthesis